MKEFFKHVFATVVGLVVFLIIIGIIGVMSIVGIISSSQATQTVSDGGIESLEWKNKQVITFSVKS